MSDKVQLIKKEIERRISNLEQIGDRKEIEIHFPEQFKFIEMYEGLLLFIDTLPEEPSVKGLTWKDVNTLDTLIDQVRHEFPNGISEKSFGLAVLEKFQDYHDDAEEPVSEDLEEEIDKELISYYNEHFSPCENGILLSEESGRELDGNDYEYVARHFYELGLNARKEE